MNNSFEGKLILGLETGLSGGSVSIIRNGNLIDSTEGSGNLSRSEDLLVMTEELLSKNGLQKRKIGLIAVSDEPGSVTGIRIGLASAKGLGEALSVRVCRISLLKALAVLSGAEGRVFAAFYAESNGIFSRKFEIRKGETAVTSEMIFKKEFSGLSDIFDVLENRLFKLAINEELEALLLENLNKYSKDKQGDFCVIKGNSSEIIGRSAPKCV